MGIKLNISIQSKTLNSCQNSGKDDLLKIHMEFGSWNLIKRIKYYRLVIFPKGIRPHLIHRLSEQPVSNQKTYSIDVSWTKNPAPYIYIFEDLSRPGKLCAPKLLCQNQAKFEIESSPFPNYVITLLTSEITDLASYTVIITDEDMKNFKLYTFSLNVSTLPRTTARVALDPPATTTSEALAPPITSTSEALDSTATTTSEALTPPITTTSEALDSPATTTSEALDPPITTTREALDSKLTTSTSQFSNQWTIILLAIVCGILAVALITSLSVRFVRRRQARLSGGDTVDQGVAGASQRRLSDGYEVLPGERISGDYEHIVEDRRYEQIEEDRRLSDGYEVIPCQDSPRSNRRDFSSNVYQTISRENVRCSPQEATSLSKNEETKLKRSQSCSNIKDGKVDIFKHAEDNRTYDVEKSEPFHKSRVPTGQTNESGTFPPLQYFMLRDSIEDVRCANAFYTTEAKENRDNIELQELSSRQSCPTDAEGDGDYLTVLDSETEQRCSADAHGASDCLTVLDSSSEPHDYLELIAD
ncbi:hypothetical protein PoB_003523300 [Plakobranchus ocellatus]|uniref:Cadherin domain-containing protein n=1 Tax=Plakobranchus ocellatus TaxID=259542 RepID=A0AAV4AQ84_9GAST|nr:hypothetical protein PoB_003523300 [Plakobranchus ocellatus]